MKAHTMIRAAALVVLSVFVLVTTVGRLSGSDADAAAVAKDFTITTTPLSASVQRGQAATFALATVPVGGFAGKVTLSASGLATGMAATFAPSSFTLDGATAASSLTVTTSSATPSGSVTLTVTGTSGSTKRSLSLVVVVSAPPAAGLAVAVTPASVSVAPGSSATYAVGISRLNGYAGAIALTASGTLPGVAALLSPSSIPAGSGSPTSVTLTVTTSASSPASTTALTLTATAVGAVPGVSSSATAALVIDTTQSSKPFTLSGDAVGPLTPGQAPSPIDLGVTNPNNQPLNITNLGVTVTGTSRATCGAAEFTVRQYAGSYPLAVAARAQGVRLTTVGVPLSALPAIAMLDRPGNQDDCKGVTVHLAYTGTATNQ